ncbi:MAG: hypothetical protein HC880_16295 [Bacteroidia bacterium]|nr:hypothetical protein [Bacteroidia bacterium]
MNSRTRMTPGKFFRAFSIGWKVGGIFRISTAKIRELEGKVIELNGYMYPFETASTHTHFALSYLPVSACFFCGGAGPETVVEIKSVKPIKYSDKKIHVRGKLKLNRSFSSSLFYTLEEAEQF